MYALQARHSLHRQYSIVCEIISITKQTSKLSGDTVEIQWWKWNF